MGELSRSLTEGVLTLGLARPDARNALNRPLLDEIFDALMEADQNSDIRALVLKAQGRSFCSGADLVEWAEAEAAGALETYGWTERAHAVILKLQALSKPTIALVQGAAVGAGADLAFACDFRLIGASGSFRCGYLSMAYSPDMGSTWLGPRLIGEQKAKAYLFLNEKYDAARALEVGLADSLVADDQLAATGEALARRLARAPTFALSCTKMLLAESAGRDFASQLAAESEAALACGRTRDADEALKAASERRDAQFSGR